MRTTTTLALLTGAALFASGSARAAPAACTMEGLSGLHVADVTIASVRSVAAKDGVPEHCLVEGAVTTRGDRAPDGRAGFQLQLPVVWQKRFLFMGVGGNGGSFIPSANAVDRAAALGKGYATAITDTGHQGRNTDASWVVDASGKRDAAKTVDFFHRAAHQVTVAGKKLVEAYYAGAISHAYFDGCSTGGRMAMMEAERYPTDYDGVIAGAPAMDYRSLLGSCGDAEGAVLLARGLHSGHVAAGGRRGHPGLVRRGRRGEGRADPEPGALFVQAGDDAVQDGRAGRLPDGPPGRRR